MRKHGWQLPYHPLQVVAIAVFLALGFAFYVFFVPFVGKKLFQYVVMGLYTPLVTFVFLLYIWCAATDPGDPGISKSKKNGKVDENMKQHNEGSRQVGSDNELHAAMTREKPVHEGVSSIATSEKLQNKPEGNSSSCWASNLLGLPFFWCHSHEQSSEQKSEEGMFFCSLCEVEVLKFSKHCRVCDKCVDGFDHHCRWLNNCIGRANYRRFFVLMVSAVVLLILQWSIGVLVLIRCFVERRKFSVEIVSKLGSSFSLVPFVIVVASCTFLAMVATLPLAQLFFFHILLIKKGISTYDYIIALREQEEQDGGQQSPRMSPVSSLTGLSSASSFSAFRRGSWCTPPRLFLEDQYDVVPPEIAASLHSTDKKSREDDGTRRKSVGTVKISPWTLARLNAEEVSKAAARARKKSRILQPIARQDLPPGQETDSSYGSTSGRIIPRPDNKRRTGKRGRITGLTADLSREPLAKITAAATRSNGSILAAETSANLAPLQLEARSAFRPSRTPSSTGNIASSPDSSLDSPDLHPYRISSGTEEIQGLTSLPVSGTTPQRGIQLSRSTSDGYEASGGEDSDRIPSRIVHRSSNWSSIVLNSHQSEMATDLKASSSGGRLTKNRLL